MLKSYPWQHKQWQLLQQAITGQRLGSAYLLTGPLGIGINQFARGFAASLFCSDPGPAGEPCTQCKACILMQAGNHPDLMLITPEEDAKQIKVGQIRNLIEFVSLKSQYEGYKVVVISPADAMNRNAANTLLKVLEEPPGLVLFLLLTHRPHGLPVTIRSRCQQIHFAPAYNDLAQAWLRNQVGEGVDIETELYAAHGAPLAALYRHENHISEIQDEIIADLASLQTSGIDPVATAEKWNRYEASRVCHWLLDFVHTMTLLKAGATVSGQYYTAAQYSGLQQLINRLHLHSLMQLYDLFNPADAFQGILYIGKGSFFMRINALQRLFRMDQYLC